MSPVVLDVITSRATLAGGAFVLAYLAGIMTGWGLARRFTGYMLGGGDR